MRCVRAFTVVALATIAVLATAVPALSHAMLVSADPADRSSLDAPPAAVTLTFNEPIEVPTGGLRVFDAEARRVDTGPLETGDQRRAAVGLPPDLPDGGYVVTYRVLSADSHPVVGVLQFTVGDAEAVDSTVVSELSGAGGAGAGLIGVLGPLLRGLGYVATLLAVGALAFTVLVARELDDRRTARLIGLVAAYAGLAVTVLAIPVQGASVAGGGILGALSPTVMGEVAMSSFGLSSLLRGVGLAGLAVSWRRALPGPVPSAAAGAAIASYLFDGHQQTVEPAAALVGGGLVHLVAGAVWFGGVVVLAAALRRRDLDDDPVVAARLVARFSSVALAAVAAVTVGGIAMAVPLVGSLDALISTGYGLTLSAKVLAVVAVLTVAFYNRQRLVPAIAARMVPAGGSLDTAAAPDRPVDRSRAAWRQLTLTVRAEAIVLVGVLLVTGFLVVQRPAAEAAGLTGLYATTVALDDGLDLDLVVDPNEAGLNTIHLYVLEDGRPSTQVDDLTLELTFVPEGIGPIVIEPFFAGPGHFVATTQDLAFAGDWEIRVVAGLGRFTEVDATVLVPVAP